MSSAHHKSRKKPRLEVDFEDTGNGSILIKRVVRNARGVPVEDILPRRAGYGSTSDSSSSQSDMGKRKDSRRDRDRFGERRDKKKKRHRDDGKRNEIPQSSAVYKSLARGLKPPPKDHKRHKRRDEKGAPRRTSNSHRNAADSEEEAPPGRHHGASTSEKHGKSAPKTETAPQKGVSCGTSMTPFRFENPADKQARNFPEGRINLTLNLCGVSTVPTIVEKPPGITIKCNHPQPICARTEVHEYETNALQVDAATRGAQPALRDFRHRAGALPQLEDYEARLPREPERLIMQSVVPYSDDSGESSPDHEGRDLEPGKENREMSIKIPSKQLSSFSSPHHDPDGDIRDENVFENFSSLKEELSQSQNSFLLPSGGASSLNFDQHAFAVPKAKHGIPSKNREDDLERLAMGTPHGPSRTPYEITKTLQATTPRRNIAGLALQSPPASTSLKKVMMEAYMNDCLASLSSQDSQRAPKKSQQGSDRVNFFPTEATIGDCSSHGRPSNPSSTKSGGSRRNLEMEASLEEHLVEREVQTLANDLISARNPNSADRQNSGSQRNRASPAVRDGRLSQRNLTRVPNREVQKSSDLVAVSETEGSDGIREAYRAPQSETESLHLPVVITDRKRASRQQLVEVQVKDKNVNRARKSSCFDPVDRGPPIPEILADLVESTHKDRYQEITIDDVRKANLVGQFDRSFLALSKSPDGSTLLLIDQHAVHERILLEQLEDECFRNTDHPTPTVILAPAVIVKLEEPAQVHLVRRDAQMMENHGFLVKILQNEVISIQTAPRCLSTRDVERLRRTTTSLFEEFIRGSETFSAIFHRVLKSKACHSAIKCPRELTKATQERLIQDMLKCRLPFQCCHGRPSINPISSNTLRVFTQDHASQNALWNKIEVNVDMEHLDKTYRAEP